MRKGFVYAIFFCEALGSLQIYIASLPQNYPVSATVLIRKIFENHQSDPVLIRPGKTMHFYFAS